MSGQILQLVASSNDHTFLSHHAYGITQLKMKEYPCTISSQTNPSSSSNYPLPYSYMFSLANNRVRICYNTFLITFRTFKNTRNEDGQEEAVFHLKDHRLRVVNISKETKEVISVVEENVQILDVGVGYALFRYDFFEHERIEHFETETCFQFICQSEIQNSEKYVRCLDECIKEDGIVMPQDIIKMILSYFQPCLPTPRAYLNYVVVETDDLARILHEKTLPATSFLPFVPRDTQDVDNWLFVDEKEIIPISSKCLDQFLYTLPSQEYGSLRYEVYYVKYEDLKSIKSIHYLIDGQEVVNLPLIWLEINHARKRKTWCKLDYIVLPFPPLPKLQHKCHQIKIVPNSSSDSVMFNLYCRSEPFHLNTHKTDTFFYTNLFPLVEFKTLPEIPYEEDKSMISTETDDYKVVFKIQFVLYYDGKLCPYEDNNGSPNVNQITCNISKKRPHPFRKLSITAANILLSEGDGEYYSHVIPRIFGNKGNDDMYMTYHVIFQNIPNIQPYDVSYCNSTLADFLTDVDNPHKSISTISLDRLNSMDVNVEWNENVIEKYYPKKSTLKLQGIVQGLNKLSLN